MKTRRTFLQEMMALAGATGMMPGLLDSIQRASAIDPAPNSTFLDAEHVVILMQENRSFDHAMGSLRGVRGFNDPRAIQLPNGHPVWVQTNEKGEHYSPFRLDIRETRTTWMGCLPHSWTDQVDAANGGKHDRWLAVKKSGTPEYAAMPLTLGYHTRADLPFYYALADAFTVCDQNFCSTLTGTTPNRLHLWTGTIRARPDVDSPALVRNEDCDYGKWASYTTFPERLENLGVFWKIYQNELSLPTGLGQAEEPWLANFTDNPLEWFTQFQVRFLPTYRTYLEKTLKTVPLVMETLSKQLQGKNGELVGNIQKRLEELKGMLAQAEKDYNEFTPEKFARLTPREKSLFARAFCTNVDDPNYRQLTDITCDDAQGKKEIKVPRGDVLHQFRKDVNAGTLPTVSWLVPPERFSDHPGSAWYGQWYLAEVLDILTRNPEIWKKTIFILTYDENDGYFDHVPPFQAPHPSKPETGRTSRDLDTTLEYHPLEQDLKNKPPAEARGNSLGLGFRVPMIIASPWSRGGFVCSQVFDHTSVLQLLEKLLSHKTGKKLVETNITPWRRGICGDLTSAFRSGADPQYDLNGFLKFKPFVEEIFKSQFKKLPDTIHPLTVGEIEQMVRSPRESLLPRQEPGTRPACPIPYQLAVEGSLNRDRSAFTLRMDASREFFGPEAASAPLIVYALLAEGKVQVRHYAVQAGQPLEDSWKLEDFASGNYHLRVTGPNGFYREFIGNRQNPSLDLRLKYSTRQAVPTGNIEIVATGHDIQEPIRIPIHDYSYGQPDRFLVIRPGETTTLAVDLQASHGWYDIGLTTGSGWVTRYAGHVETGKISRSDPAMGR